MLRGFIWQKQYNQLNSPVTLELIDSIKNDYLSTWDTREMVREKWVITVMGQLTLEVTGRKKNKNHLAWKVCSKFVTIQQE